MAQLIATFNALEFDPTQSAGQLPIGKHKVVAESSEVKPTSNNDGGYLQFNLKVIDGPNAGASGAFRLNLYNASQKAVEIANKQMSALCHVTGVFQVSDSSQLHNIPFMVEVAPQKDNPQYTEVKKLFDANGNEPGKQGQAAHSNQQPAMQQQSNPVGGFGSQAPQQPQGQTWGQPQQQQQPAGNAPAWGQQAAQQPQQPAPQGNPQGWQQQQPQGNGNAPWGGNQANGQQQPQQQPAWGQPR